MRLRSTDVPSYKNSRNVFYSLTSSFCPSSSLLSFDRPQVRSSHYFDFLRFPLLHFGKLFGAGHLISAVIGSVQYGLFTVAEDNLEKDPFWVSF